jgi:diacylglycerol kinase
MDLVQQKSNTPDSYLVRQVKSFKYAFRGLYFALGDYNFLVHIPSAILVVLTAWFFNVNTVEWLFLLSAIFGVWVCEILNTSIELLTDMVSPEFHLMAGKIKDLAAGAVLLTSIYAILVACIIFIPYLTQILNN